MRGEYMCSPHVLMWVSILPSMPFYDLLERLAEKRPCVSRIASKKSVWNTITKESPMQMFILLFLVLVVVAYVGYTTYRSNAERRAIEKKRNQYHDRV